MLRIQRVRPPNKSTASASGVSATIPVADGEFAKLLAVSYGFVADGTVANRVPYLTQSQGVDGGDYPFIRSGDSWLIGAITAGQTHFVSHFPGGGAQAVEEVGNFGLSQPLAQVTWSGPFNVVIDAQNLQAGDQITNVHIWVAVGTLEDVAFA